MERCAASVGTFEVTVAGRFAPRKYQAPPAMTMNAIPAASSIKLKRCLGAAGLIGLALASEGLPTSSE